jgi:hypothetical protein
MEGIVFIPTREDVEVEEKYWVDMDRVAEYDAWFISQAEVQDEDECHDDCFCAECRSAWDEYQELDREYRRSTSGR